MLKILINLIILFLLLSCTKGQTVELPKGVMIKDKLAPKLQLKDLDGKEFNLNSVKGKWVLVHFWASWCGPCRKEMPTIVKLKQAVKGENIHIVLINTAENEDTIFSFLAGVAPDLNSLMDPDGSVTEIWQPRGLPASFFVDPEGKIRYLALGGRPWDSAEYINFVNKLKP